MSEAIHLTLMVGPAVAKPVSRTVVEALQSVSVKTTSGRESQSGFELVFSLDKSSPLYTVFLLTAGALPPIMRVILVVTVGATTRVLIDGVITKQSTTTGGSGSPTLTVSGVDLTEAMRLIDFTGFWFPAMPPSARVLLILAKYAGLGIVPKVLPSVLFEIPNPLVRIPIQEGTDYEYITKLADETGYVFYLETGSNPGSSTAYWGPEIKTGTPQPALNLDMDVHTNVESLSFDFDGSEKVVHYLTILESLTKVPIPIPIPDISPLNPPLGLVPPLSLRFKTLPGVAKYGPIRAAMIGMAKASQSSDVVTANGTLDVLRYGHILEARKLVGVRGAGLAFDGLYFVKSVVHKIQRGQYTQSFTLSRNGLVSTVDRVTA